MISDNHQEISGKKCQILDGARRVFLEMGFDGASIANIVAAANVSKGTLYAHFESKEKLFESFIFEDRRHQAEQLFDIDLNNSDIETVLFELGQRFVTMISSKEALSHLRTVIAVAGRIPTIGQAYYQAGPLFGIQKLSAYLKTQIVRGKLNIDRPEHAACQFLDLCKSNVHLPLVMGVESEASNAGIVQNIREAVDMFLKMYKICAVV